MNLQITNVKYIIKEDQLSMSELIDFKPEDISETSVDTLLNSLDLGIMRDNITQQIRGIIKTQQNFLGIVLEKFDIIVNNMHDLDDRREIEYEVIDFCRELILEFAEQYNFCYDDDLGRSKTPIHILKTLYNFFILRGKEFVTDFFIKYIQTNRNHLVQTLRDNEEPSKIKDITTISNEKKYLSGDTLWVVSHLDSVINFICSLEISSENFIRMINDGDFYIEKMLEHIERGDILGDFVTGLLDRYINDPDHETEIKNDVKLQILRMEDEV